MELNAASAEARACRDELLSASRCSKQPETAPFRQSKGPFVDQLATLELADASNRRKATTALRLCRPF